MLYSSRYTQPNRASFGQISHLVTEELTSICSESKHIAGNWSDIYDQSFKVELDNGLRFLANFKYSVKP